MNHAERKLQDGPQQHVLGVQKAKQVYQTVHDDSHGATARRKPEETANSQLLLPRVKKTPQLQQMLSEWEEIGRMQAVHEQPAHAVAALWLAGYRCWSQAVTSPFKPPLLFTETVNESLSSFPRKEKAQGECKIFT